MMDIITYILCRKYAKKYTDEQISMIAKGMTFKGSVATTADLPLEGNTIGDLYLVEENKTEYVWTIEAASGTIDNWKDLNGVDLSNYYTKEEVDAKIPDISGKADIDYVNSEINKVKEEIPDVSGFATKTELNTKQDKLSVEDNSGIIIVDNKLDRDPNIIPDVERVNTAINTVLDHVNQKLAIERGERIASDNLKQDKIDDLADIREGAALGKTAIQDISHLATKTELENKQNKLEVNEANPTIDLNSLTINDVVYKIAGEAKIGKTFTTDIAVGHLAAGTEIDSNTKIADLLYAMLFESTPVVDADLYIGHIVAPCTASQFAAKTLAELQAGILYEKLATDTPFRITTSWGNGEMSIYFIMVKDGFEPAYGEMVSGGITSPFNKEDILNPEKWKALHDNVIINNTTYRIYGYRTRFNANDTMSITIEKVV